MTLEVCVDDLPGLDAAIAGGADRIELCAALSLGGLSPAPGLITAARNVLVPVHMLIRPHDGPLRYQGPRSAALLAADIDAAAQAGLAGVVIGANTGDGLDVALLAELVAHARAAAVARGQPLSITLHRAFDLCRDLPAALGDAVALGFDRVLTSAAMPRAADGLAMLARLHRIGAGRIVILAGGGIDADCVAAVIASGVTEIHASCSSLTVDETGATAEQERRFGFTRPHHRHTDVERVRALKWAMVKFRGSDLCNTNP